MDVFISTVPGLVLLSTGQFTSKAVDLTIKYKKRKHSMWMLKPSYNFSLTVSVSVAVCLSLSLCELYKIMRVLKKINFLLKCSHHLIELRSWGGGGEGWGGGGAIWYHIINKI